MFEIKILDNQTFDSLGPDITKGADISDSLGFSDPTTGKAYVRYVAHPELQKYLIDHEFEELLAEESMHEDEFGIRHKKGPKFFKQIFMPFIAPFIAAAIPGVGGVIAQAALQGSRLLGRGKSGGQPGIQGPPDSTTQGGNPFQSSQAQVPQTVFAPQGRGFQPASPIEPGRSSFTPALPLEEKISQFRPNGPSEPRFSSFSAPLPQEPRSPGVMSQFQPQGQASFQGGGGGVGSSLSSLGSNLSAGLSRMGQGGGGFGLNRLNQGGGGFGFGSDLFNQFYRNASPYMRF